MRNGYDNMLALEHIYAALKQENASFELHVDLQHREATFKINSANITDPQANLVHWLIRHMFHGINWSMREYLPSERSWQLYPLDGTPWKT